MTCQGHIKQAAITEWSPFCRDLNEAKTRFDRALSECKQMGKRPSQILYNKDKEILTQQSVKNSDLWKPLLLCLCHMMIQCHFPHEKN